jgi:hypothetical protein
MYQFLLALFLAIFPRLCFAQVQNSLSIKDLKQDVAALRTALEKYHPRLNWYTPKEEYSRTWDSLDRRLNQPLTELEFYRLLLPVVAKVKCAHTFFYPSDFIMSTGTRFPIDVKLIGEKLYLMPKPNTYNIPVGSELISINGKPTSIILEQLMPNLQAQGGNVGWKKVILENDFQNYYYYTIEQPQQFVIKYINYETAAEESKVIEGGNDKLLTKHWKNWYPITDGPPLSLKVIENTDVAVVTIKSLVRDRAKSYHQDFDKLIDEYFEEIGKKKIRKLIIDVRGNEGGNKPEKLYSYVAFPNHSRQKGNFSVTPAKNHFEGRVIVLANERSISAEETFVSIFKYYKRGLIVGRSTPGCFKGLCGGKKHALTLPNSRFKILIPTHPSLGIYGENTELKPGEGYPPDFLIEESINGIVENKDDTMIFALDLIQK